MTALAVLEWAALVIGVGVGVAGASTVIVVAPRLLAGATFVAAFISLPAQIPLSFNVAGSELRLYEPLLVACAARYVFVRPSNGLLTKVLLAMSGVVVIWGAVGLAAGNPANRVLSDTRPLVLLICAALVVGKLQFGLLTPRRDTRLLSILFWVSAMTTVAAAVTTLEIGGQQASPADSTEELPRLISPSTYLAAAALAMLLVYWLTGRPGLGLAWTIGLPATLLVFLSFTRNSVVLILTAALFGTIALRAYRRGLQLAFRLAVTIGVAAAAHWVLMSTSGANWLTEQLEFFSSRVLGGLAPGALSEDPSAQYRLSQENPYLYHEIASSPIVGHGFGFAYRPLLTGRYVFSDNDALQSYAHNFYLWIFVKTGVLGALLFLGALVRTMWAGLRSGTAWNVAGTATLVGCLASSVVAPMPLGSPSSLIVGGLVGLILGDRESGPRGKSRRSGFRRPSGSRAHPASTWAAGADRSADLAQGRVLPGSAKEDE